eukprot:GHUV01018048.1.p1 GENE.GHUV01018048.1~~GHUV01018048.1.p1  ORF type:complete len:164 (+),score=53.53 GHUV01018048.1:1038-1529(+)
MLMCVHASCSHPFCYFPVFYGMKGYVEGRSPASIYEKYRADLWENCKALWTIWVPAQLVNFSVVPRHLRIPFVAGVSFAWTVIISVMRGALDGTKAAAPTTAQLEEAVTHVAAAVAEPVASAAAAAAPAASHAPVISAGQVQASAGASGLKALVPHAHAEATS